MLHNPEIECASRQVVNMRKMGWAAFLTTSWMLFSTASPGDALEYRDPATGISLIYPSQWNVGENNDHRVTFGSG